MTTHKGVSAAEKYAELEASGEKRPKCKCHSEPMRWTHAARKRAGGYWTCRLRHWKHRPPTPTSLKRYVRATVKYRALNLLGLSRPNCDCHNEVMTWCPQIQKSGGVWVCSEGLRERARNFRSNKYANDPVWRIETALKVNARNRQRSIDKQRELIENGSL